MRISFDINDISREIKSYWTRKKNNTVTRYTTQGSARALSIVEKIMHRLEGKLLYDFGTHITFPDNIKCQLNQQ